MRYRKKPVVIEALQWDGTAEGATPIIQWILDNGHVARYHDEQRTGISPYRPGDLNEIFVPAHIAIDTLEGTMMANAGDWVIKGVAGEFYPCRNDIFEATYEAAMLDAVITDEGRRIMREFARRQEEYLADQMRVPEERKLS